jgi:hypothetical protein
MRPVRPQRRRRSRYLKTVEHPDLATHTFVLDGRPADVPSGEYPGGPGVKGSTPVSTVSGDFELTMEELRVVARFVVESAQSVLPVFEDAHPGDSRPRVAIDAAWEFVNGDAYRAAKEATTEAARLAARSAGDAASAAYLHPIAQTNPGRAYPPRHRERCPDRRAAGGRRSRRRSPGDRRGATPRHAHPDRRPPPISLAPAAKNRVSQLMAILDASLRASCSRAP